MAVIYDLVSVQVIALLGSDVTLLATSPDPSFVGKLKALQFTNEGRIGRGGQQFNVTAQYKGT